MALSGSFSATQRNGNEVVRCDWTGTQDIGNNKTTITAKLYFTNKYAISIGERTHTITINGTAKTLTSAAINTTGEHYIGSVSVDVPHNADGTKSISMSFVFSLKATLSGTYYESMSSSTTASLNTIPRTSTPTLSASSVNFGSNITIYTHRASTSFTHHLYYSFNGGSEVGITPGIGDSYTWTVPSSLMNSIPNATSATITFRLYTFNGSTNIGSKTISFTATVPSSVVPSISSISVVDSTNLKDTYGGYVQNKSKAKITVSASGSYSSTIKSYSITANGTTYNSNGSTTSELKTAGTNTISVTVTDSRGRTKTSTTTISVLAYTSPTISTLTATRCNSDGTANEEGTYVKVVVNASITSLNSNNTKNFTLQYKKSSDASYTTHTAYTTDYTYSATVIIANISVDYIYNILLTATDAFSSVNYQVDVLTAFTLMDFNKDGKGIAFGKVSTEDGFDVNMVAKFRQGLTGSSVKTNSGADLDEVVQTVAKMVMGKQTEGKSGFYWKFPNNMLVQTYTAIFTNVAFTNSWGNLYESALLDLGTFQIPFKTTPWVFLSIAQGACLIERSTAASYAPTPTSAGKCYFVKPTNTTLAEIRVNVLGIERYE